MSLHDYNDMLAELHALEEDIGALKHQSFGSHGEYEVEKAELQERAAHVTEFIAAHPDNPANAVAEAAE